ncbi:MAG: hypothetical protein OJF50_006417 [Nitrospira sp.]|jgi:hypothetical protein|nr:hypothetical protein [Nitrospira sp.]
MRYGLLFSLLFLASLLPVSLWAQNDMRTMRVSDSYITASTLIQGAGWSGTGNRNESLACDLVQSRAMSHLKAGLAVAEAKSLRTTAELMSALHISHAQDWDQAIGRCTVRLEVHVPSRPTSHISPLASRRF